MCLLRRWYRKAGWVIEEYESRIVLSFDDGRGDNYTNVKPILDRYGLKATFNIATAYVDGTIPLEWRPCDNPPMTIEQIKELQEEGHEIAAHGDCHKNDMNDIVRGVQKLREWGVAGRKLGFASPNSNITEERINEMRPELMRAGIEYVRLGLPKSGLGRRVLRYVARMTHSIRLYVKGFAWHLGTPGDGYIVYSIPVMRSATLHQIQGTVNTAWKRGAECVLMFHSILKPDEEFYNDTWSWDYSDFEELCVWIALGGFSSAGRLS